MMASVCLRKISQLIQSSPSSSCQPRCPKLTVRISTVWPGVLRSRDSSLPAVITESLLSGNTAQTPELVKEETCCEKRCFSSDCDTCLLLVYCMCSMLWSSDNRLTVSATVHVNVSIKGLIDGSVAFSFFTGFYIACTQSSRKHVMKSLLK